MQALTDFADEAVVLPLIAVVALMLGLLGWRRGALAWLGAVGLSFTSVLALKLVFATCGPALGLPALRSPSGHTAAAAVVAGGIAVVLGQGRQQVGHRQTLCGQDAVHRLQRKLAPAAQEVGNVRLSKTRLPRQ